MGAREMAHIKSMCCSYRGPQFSCQHTSVPSQPPITKDPKDLTPSSDLYRNCTHVYRNTHNLKGKQISFKRMEKLNFVRGFTPTSQLHFPVSAQTSFLPRDTFPDLSLSSLPWPRQPLTFSMMMLFYLLTALVFNCIVFEGGTLIS